MIMKLSNRIKNLIFTSNILKDLETCQYELGRFKKMVNDRNKELEKLKECLIFRDKQIKVLEAHIGVLVDKCYYLNAPANILNSLSSLNERKLLTTNLINIIYNFIK